MPSACSSALQSYAGPEAEELAILCRPGGGSLDPAGQGEAVYRALAETLSDRKASFREVTCETLFLRDVERDLLPVLEARRRVLADLAQGDPAPMPAFIEQAPLDQKASFELAAAAVLPHQRDAWSVRDVRATPICRCEGCMRSGARMVCLGSQTTLHTTNVYGTGGDAFEQASNTFAAAERLLEQCGMEFGDVVRTWIHLRNIDRDYDALNRARREFFRDRGIERMPASTGVQGIPFPAAHDFSISLCAMKASKPLEARSTSTPTLNEAWSYGADFSRGLRVAEANKETLYISGTASIDEGGQTVHVGDFAAQAERMLHNIATLLEQQDTDFGSLISGVAYLKNEQDAPALRTLFRDRGFDAFPCALVVAPLCRPELLCETEVTAVLPLRTPAA